MTRIELEALRRVTNVIRLGHVIRIDGDAIVLERGTVSVGADRLYVDCSAAGIRERPSRPVFDGDRITLQYIMQGGQPTYSAALTAFVELQYEDNESKNSLCQPLAITGDLVDFPRNMLADMDLRRRWSKDARIRQWMARSRLDPTAGVASRVDPSDWAKQAIMKRYRDNIQSVRSRLEALLAPNDLVKTSLLALH